MEETVLNVGVGVVGAVFGVFLTVTFRFVDKYYDTNVMTFCLGGEHRECSMVELGWRMGLYDQSVVMTKAFSTFLDNSHKVFSDGTNGSNW